MKEDNKSSKRKRGRNFKRKFTSVLLSTLLTVGIVAVPSLASAAVEEVPSLAFTSAFEFANIKVFETVGGGTVSKIGQSTLGFTFGLGWKEYKAQENPGWQFDKWTYTLALKGEQLGNRVDGVTGQYTFSNSHNSKKINYDDKGKIISVNRLLSAGETYRNPLSYTITANFNPTIVAYAEDRGTISDPGSSVVNIGGEKTYQIRAEDGYQIKAIIVDDIDTGVGAGATECDYRFSNVQKPHSISVEFEAKPVTMYNIDLSANSAEGGTVEGAGSYAAGTSLTVKAVPNDGYHFVKWVELEATRSGAESTVSTDQNYTFTVDRYRYLVAIFEADPPVNRYHIELSASPAEGGTVTGGGTYDEGATVTVKAVPNAGYHFVEWREMRLELELNRSVKSLREMNGVSVSGDQNHTFAATDHRFLIAIFEKDARYQITLSADPAEGGTVTGGGTYGKNSSTTIKATATNGYKFVKWTENGNEVSKDAGYNVTVTEDRNFVAVFEKEKTVTVNDKKVSQASPKTGDNNSIPILLGLLVASVGALTLAGFQIKKRNNTTK